MIDFPITLPPTAAIEIQSPAAHPPAQLDIWTLLTTASEPVRPPSSVEIGAKWTPAPAQPMPLTPDGHLLQTALLEPRTDPARRWPWYAVLAGAFYRWC